MSNPDHTFLTAKQISSVTIPLLARELVLAGTVARIAGGEYAGPNGDTVTVRVPNTIAARTQGTAGAEINFDDITESPVDVQLAHLYSAVRVSDESLSLELVDFATQVTSVQVEAVARAAEAQLATRMSNLIADEVNVNPDDIEDAILEAREALSKADVPAADRYMAVGPEVTTALLAIDKWVRVDASGNDSALRNATIGRLYGFTFVESNALGANEAIAYHRTGFAWANRVPVRDASAVDTAVVQESGVGLRQLLQWNPERLSKYSVLETYAGANVVDADRVYKFELPEQS